MRATTAVVATILILVAEVWKCAASAEDATKHGKWEFGQWGHMTTHLTGR